MKQKPFNIKVIDYKTKQHTEDLPPSHDSTFKEILKEFK